MTNLFDGRRKNVLHVASERCLESQLQKRLGRGYLTADLSDPRAMVILDITNIPYIDQSFDVIYCSHVLEHVLDDRKAMKELWRVLKDSGWAILLVPITADETFEDVSVVTPAERLAIFGQEDHVRRYGPDYVDRLREAGFVVKTTVVSDFIHHDEAVRLGLQSTDEIHHCTKR